MTVEEEIAYRAMKKFIIEHKKSGKSFTIWDIEEYVRKKAGTTMLAPGRRVRDWIEDAKIRGKIREIAPLEYIVVF